MTDVAQGTSLTVWTYDWVPDAPRGHLRDLRLRWALEEAGLDYAVRSTPFEQRTSAHLARQPTSQREQPAVAVTFAGQLDPRQPRPEEGLLGLQVIHPREERA